MQDNLEGNIILNTTEDEDAPSGDLEYAPTVETPEDIEFNINECELELKALRERRE